MLYPVVIGGIDQSRFVGHTSLVINFCGCNLRCGYCNAIRFVKSIGCTKMNTSDILSEVMKYMPMVDSVILTGGEPTIYDIYPLVRLLKSQGILIKLETNGQNPDILERLCKERLVDKVSLDVKGVETDMKALKDIIGRKKGYFENIERCLRLNCPMEIVFPVIPLVTDSPDKVREVSMMARTTGSRLILQEFDPDNGTLSPRFDLIPRTPRKSLVNLARVSVAETYIRTRTGGLEFVKPRS